MVVWMGGYLMGWIDDEAARYCLIDVQSEELLHVTGAGKCAGANHGDVAHAGPCKCKFHPRMLYFRTPSCSGLQAPREPSSKEAAYTAGIGLLAASKSRDGLWRAAQAAYETRVRPQLRAC